MPNTNHKTRRQRLEEREEAIISAAHEEFVEHGFDDARIAGIAQRAGVAEGTLYLYFKNKGALLAAVVGAFYERLTEGAAAGVALRTSTDQRLGFLAQHHLESCLAEWAILALAMPVLYQTRKYRDSDYFEYNRTYVAIFDGVVREGVTRGDVRDDLPLHMMRDLFYGALEHSVRTVMVREHSVPEEADIRTMARHAMAMIRPAYGLATDQSKRPPAVEFRNIAQRLEDAASRLEAIAQGSH